MNTFDIEIYTDEEVKRGLVQAKYLVHADDVFWTDSIEDALSFLKQSMARLERKTMKFKDIPQLTNPAHYRVNQGWKNLKDSLIYYQTEKLAKLDLDPPFQRGHVWTIKQQIAYVEFKLRGGSGSDELQFNCIGWMNDYKGPFVLVDGKQRLTAVLKFMNNELPAFGVYYNDFEDSLGSMDPSFLFCINNLPSMKAVLQWYLELNSGGTPHTKEELNKVREMLGKMR